MTGLMFSEVEIGTGRARKPYAPSLDRLDRHRSYTVDNVRLVCVAANFAMNAWGLPVLETVARALVGKLDEEEVGAVEAVWYQRQDARIAQAQQEAKYLEGEALRRQNARIAALKRARTLGPAGLTSAAQKAVATRTD